MQLELPSVKRTVEYQASFALLMIVSAAIKEVPNSIIALSIIGEAMSLLCVAGHYYIQNFQDKS